MKRIAILLLIAILAFSLTATSLAAPTPAAAATARTYTVWVGAENVPGGLGVMAFFPETLRIHVGDTVLWQQVTHEIHTVTFLAGTPEPVLIVDAPAGQASPLMINPQAAFPTVPAGGLYDGSTYANSGIMSTDPGQPTQFSLTFTQAGSFKYICLVHGVMMSGTIIVVDPSVKIPTPAQIAKLAKLTMKLKLARARVLIGKATSKIPHKVNNADGTTTYTVLIGWAKGQSELMRFFPRKLVVHPGDTVNFMLSPTNDAPHTVTFLNGADDIPFIVPVPNPPGPPYLLVNPEILAPIQPGVPLTSTGIFSSALMGAGPGPTSYTFTIGATSGSLSYQCVLHDTSGMQGLLKVVPR